MAPLFNVRLLAALIVAGILAFGAFILLSVYADNLRSGSDGRGHALSVSAVGFQGVVRLVDGVGGKSRILRADAAVEDYDLMVVAVEPFTSPKTLRELIDRRTDKPTLVILPKWLTAGDPVRRGWARKIGLLGDVAALSGIRKAKLAQAPEKAARPDAIGTGMMEGISVRAPAQAQTISGDGLKPLLTTASGTLLAQVEDEEFYILADPDLMNNMGMKDPRTARAALEMLGRLNYEDAGSVAFDVTLNGFGSKPSVFQLAFEPPFLALTLALLVAALLAGLHGAFRFGPPAHEKRAIAFGKLALVENSAGLIQLARREHRVGGAYADVIRETAAAASGAPPNLHGEALDAYLDTLSPKDGTPFTAHAAQARDCGDRYELLRAARALFQWKKDNIR